MTVSQQEKRASSTSKELTIQADADTFTPHIVKRMTRSQRLKRVAMLNDNMEHGIPTTPVRDAEEAFLRIFELENGEAAMYTFDTTIAKEAEKFVKRMKVYTNSNCMPHEHIAQISRREVDGGIRALVEVFPRATPRGQRHLHLENLGFWTDRGGEDFIPKPERYY